MNLNHCFIGLLFLAGPWCHAGTPAISKAATTAGSYGQLPLVFERNQGQAPSAIRFLARGHRYVVGLVDDGLQLRLRKNPHTDAPDRAVEMHFTESSHHSSFQAPDKLPGVSNYLIGNNPQSWIQGVPQYGKVWQRGIYPGIDVAYYGNQGQLEYDFLVHPGANLNKLQMHITGVDRLRLDPAGDLILDINGIELRQKLPVAWQEQHGARKPVEARYRLLANNTVGITAANYDPKLPLVIDPVLTLAYSTYLGGAMADQANSIAVDTQGNAWIAGSATSIDFPVTGTPKPTNAGISDAFIAKLDPTGTTLLFSTYFGGTGADQANGIAVDPLGNAYVTGSTASTNFPTTIPLQVSNAGGLDAFALKLTPAGAVVYSTYIGGTADDSASGIAVDANGAAYITGYTASTNFPTAFAQQGTNHGGKDAFILKLNAAGNALAYSTFLGGAGDDQANGIAVDTVGSAYIAGATQSNNFPLSAALQTVPTTAFVVKLSAGGLVVYSTYFGGTGGDVANAIAVDTAGDAYVVGATNSRDFPVKNAVQTQQGDAAIPGALMSSDAFLSKLNPTGSALIFSTYLGGTSTGVFSAQNPHPGGADVAYGVAVDSLGNAYVTGSTATPGSLATPLGGAFPLLDPLLGYSGPQTGVGLNPWYHTDAFLTSFSPTGTPLYSTGLGGLLDDVATAVAVDTNGGAYVTGYSKSTDFPVQTPLQAANAAVCATPTGCATFNAFVSKLTFTAQGTRVFFATAVPGNASAGVTSTLAVTGAGCSAGAYSAVSNSTSLGTPVVFQPGANCGIDVTASAPIAGARYAFSSWADGPTTNPRVITTPAHSTTYTINLSAQYQLTTTASPAFGGTITASPASADGFYPSGTVVTLTAVPNASFKFSNFTGDVIGITNPQTVTVNGPRNVTAVFVPAAVPSVAIDTPAMGAALSGMVTVSGWAIDNTTASGTPISNVQVKVDGVVLGNAAYGSARPDVCSTYPGRPNCPNVGYSFTFNANSLVPGPHTITVTATDSDGIPDTGTASVVVSSALVMPGTKVGAFRNGAAFLFDSNGNGLFENGVDRFIPSFTPPGGAQVGDVPVAGDWNGDGHTKIGIYRPSTGTWWLDADNDGIFGANDLTYQYGGLPGDIPVVGDWNAVAGTNVNKSCIGVYRTQGSVWLLDLNCNGTFEGTPADAFFPFGGIGGDVPVVGNWTGGKTRVGVVRKYAPGGVPQGDPFFWVFDASDAAAGNTPADHPPAANPFPFGGLPGDVFVTGDWNNSGSAKAGIFRSGAAGVQAFEWVLDANGLHTPDIIFNLFGVVGDKPLTGKW